MGRYITRKLAFALGTLFVALNVNFFLFRALPGNAATLYLAAPGLPEANREALKQEFGVTEPLSHQYLSYFQQLLRGNLGVSYANFQPVAGNLVHALLHTLLLVGVGLTIAVVLGVACGTVAAWRRDALSDRAIVGGALFLFALPAQWLGLVLAELFAGKLPSNGMSDPFAQGTGGFAHAIDVARHLVLPGTTLALVLFGQFVVISRTAVLETLGEDYIYAARAKGASTARALMRHALPNAMLPVATTLGVLLGAMTAGPILIETVFSWPGIGRAIYEAVLGRDWPMLQGAFLIVTACVIGINFVIDLAYGALDPRIRQA
jgi:ABC-type dipeptide/oligopeptide/nickel transport system permease component